MNASASLPGHAPNTAAPDEHPWIRALGYGGLIPFVGLALLLWLVEPGLQAFVAIGLTAYAALIVSFLGGIHWGHAWAQASLGRDLPRVHLGWGVTPSLLAWPGLLMPAYAGLVWLGALLVACYAVDRKLYPAAGLKPWLRLRFRLTAIAALSCFIGAGAV